MFETLRAAALSGIFALGFAAPALALTLGYEEGTDPVVEDAAAELFAAGTGDVFLSGFAPALSATGASAAGEPTYVQIDGFGPDDYVLTVDAGLDLFLEGAFLAAAFDGASDVLAFAFAVTSDPSGLFGDRVLAIFESDEDIEDPFSNAVEISGLLRIVNAEEPAAGVIPVPAAAALLPLGLAGLFGLRLRRRG